MAAIVGHLDHDLPAYVVDCLMCVLLGKLDSKHSPTDHDGWLPSHCLGSLHAKSVASLHPLIHNIIVA
jgi:hypothetical protein